MNLFQGDSAAIGALDNNLQGDRLLRLRFPDNNAPSQTLLLANRLDADESLSRDFLFQVEVLSDDADIALDSVLGKRVTIELVREDGTLRYFNGHVFAFRMLRTDGGFAFYDMQLGPWLAHLRLRKNSMVFQNMRLVDITEQVLNRYPGHDWRCAATSAAQQLTYVCQYNESDHNFLHRLWEAHGWYYHIEHRADGHTLQLCDDSTATAPIAGNVSSMPFQHQAGASEDDGVHAWSPVRRMAAAQATLASFDFKGPRKTEAAADSLNRQGEAPALEVYEDTGSYGYPDFEAGRAQARLRMEEIDARGLLYEARGNDRTAEPNRWFTLAGHYGAGPAAPPASGQPPGTAAPAEYLIVEVRHHASNNYQDGRGASSSYTNSFTCLDRRVPWRPGRGFHSAPPKAHGVQTATVVGPPGEQIYTDAYGRIKLQFHWDRLGKFDHASSPWVRVMSTWAGSGFGQISLPRIGMEVVVQFIDGNLDRPLVIGCLYNAAHQPPWALPANKTQSGVLTRSSNPGEPAHANALRFEDKKGAEEVWLHAEKDQRLEVEHDESHWVGNDRRKTVERDETVQVRRDRTETVGRDETITVRHDRSERVDGDEHIDIGGERIERVGKNEHIKIDGDRAVHIDGHKTERIGMTKEESILLAKFLSIGGAYQTTVGAAMNTTVALAQSEQIGLSKTVMVGDSSSLTAQTEHKIVVGGSTITITPQRIEIVADEIIIRGNRKVQVHGDDIDHNPD